MHDFKLSIGSKEIEIKDKYTLVLGKFKKDQLIKYFDGNFIKILKKLELIPLEDFIKLLQVFPEEFKNIDKAINLLAILNEFNKISEKNLEIITHFHQNIEELIRIFRFNILKKTRISLLQELELSKKYHKLSNLAATKDLVKKLNDSIELNKNKLKYLEQDYLQQKNQLDRVKKTIHEYNQKIQKLSTNKKEIFSQINKITRQMEIGTPNEPDKEIVPSYSQRIRNLQTKAKEIQTQINETNAKLNESNIKLQGIEPQFLTYESDYQKILETIRNDESKIISLQEEVMKEINSSEINFNNELDNIKLRTVRNPSIIQNEIKNLEIELNKIEISSKFFNPESPLELSLIKNEFQEIEKKINEKVKMKESFNEKDINNSIEGFRKIDTAIKDLEFLLKIFLQEINLLVNLEIMIEENSKNFFILLKFIRNNKQEIDFGKLTTPEKIFFVVILYISLKVLIKSENILFSNLFLPTIYNKRGSLIRTIKKILPQFEDMKNLTRFNLIFVFSNIELKDKIKNLKVIKINES